MLTPSGTINTYTVGGNPAVIDSGLTVSSYDTDLTGATITISAGTFQSGDNLNFNNSNGITGSYNSSTGTLTLTGSATVATYQAALEAVVFSNVTNNPNTTTRSISIVADDGSLTSNPAAEQVKVAVPAPVVTPSGTINTFTIGGSPVAVDDSSLTVSTMTPTSERCQHPRFPPARYQSGDPRLIFTQSKRYHRLVQLRYRHADPGRQRDARHRNIETGPAVGQFLVKQQQHAYDATADDPVPTMAPLVSSPAADVRSRRQSRPR